MVYPYQIVTFLGKEPAVGESIYRGKNGWFPQVALKRRFGLAGISEHELITRVEDYANQAKSFEIKLGKVYKPERMPVRVIPVLGSDVIGIHNSILSQLSDDISSRYPEREGDNYLPHMTVEWDGELLFPVQKYEGASYVISDVWLVKDPSEGEDSVALNKFGLA